jgi:diaminohydroxyphosphoribosylaminopyrimidine deaminase/5-amino-6-(5-phosphoribosylamino)uracil reductase
MTQKEKYLQSFSSSTDEALMQEAIAEAKQGRGWTTPNPIVGAVIVQNGSIIGRGFHQQAGSDHAEIMALKSLKSAKVAHGAELFITLEPCSTFGRTPPCTEAIIQAQFSRVIYGATDPNPLHAGRAKSRLNAAGIQITTGVLQEECLLLNEGWNKWIRTKMPFVIAKVAMSLDGCISSHLKRRWITSPAARRDAMNLRANVDAILVGGETIRTDNPRLTLRGISPRRPQPWRIVWTRKGNLPKDAKIFTDRYRGRTLIFQDTSLRKLLRSLGAQGINTVLMEGGGTLLGTALDQRLIDKFCLYYAPTILGGKVPSFSGRGTPSPERALRLTHTQYTRIGDEIRLVAYPISSNSKSTF